ncbi:MAG: alpha-1,2-fucosyltransferase [Paludibacter sp.]|nr:alpha-1,2-fucosyltransferase [Paludibacter sp.]
MIFVSIFGGLGNQMFQYATAKAVAKRLNVELKLDIQHVTDRKFRKNFTYRNFELSVFNLDEKIATLKEVRRYIPNLWNTNKIILQFYRIKRILTGRRLYQEKKKFCIDENIFSIKDNTYLYGYFQTSGYFEDIRSDLLYSFEFKTPPNQINRELMAQISRENAVSIHVRRGDYINSPFHLLGMDDYYMKAIKIISEKVTSPTFYIFSNDYDWVIENFKDLPIKKTIVQINNTESDAHMDMKLMSMCKHNICANSSFSWWGAWLNQYTERIIIVPQRWFNNSVIYNTSTNDLIPKDWIRI